MWKDVHGHSVWSHPDLTAECAVDLVHQMIEFNRTCKRIKTIIILDGLEQVVYKWHADVGQVMPERVT